MLVCFVPIFLVGVIGSCSTIEQTQTFLLMPGKKKNSTTHANITILVVTKAEDGFNVLNVLGGEAGGVAIHRVPTERIARSYSSKLATL